jgi:hypothetical protein
LKNTVETDGKGKVGAHDPTQRTSTSPGPCGAISRLGRTGVAGPVTEAVGRAVVVATLASSSRGWSCGPFPGLLRCPCPGRCRCPRRRRRPPRPPSLPASAAAPSFLPRRPPVTRAPASTPLRPSPAAWSGSGLVWVQQRVADAAAKGERTFRGMVASRAEGTNAAWIQGRGRRSRGDLGPGCGEEEEKGKKVLTLFFFTKSKGITRAYAARLHGD